MIDVSVIERTTNFALYQLQPRNKRNTQHHIEAAAAAAATSIITNQRIHVYTIRCLH